jgi:hypothetical protein
MIVNPCLYPVPIRAIFLEPIAKTAPDLSPASRSIARVDYEEVPEHSVLATECGVKIYWAPLLDWYI